MVVQGLHLWAEHIVLPAALLVGQPLWLQNLSLLLPVAAILVQGVIPTVQESVVLVVLLVENQVPMVPHTVEKVINLAALEPTVLSVLVAQCLPWMLPMGTWDRATDPVVVVVVLKIMLDR
jgi:hypothetical protein